MDLPVAAYEPDKAPLEGGSMWVWNVLSVSPASYGPVASPVYYSPGAANAVAMWCFQFNPYVANLFAFSETAYVPVNFYAQHITTNSTGTSWSTLAFSTGTYHPTSYNDSGNMAAYKSLVLFTHPTLPVQNVQFDTAGNPTGLAKLVNLATYPNAPQGSFLATAKDFLFLGNTCDPVGGWGPNRIWWSAINDPTSWPVPGTAAAQQVQSDYNDFAAPLGQITGLVSNLGQTDIAVFFEHGLIRGTYVGPPAIFDFVQVQGTQGTYASHSFVAVAGIVYYITEQGFFSFDGTTPIAIGVNRVDNYFLTTCQDRGGGASGPQSSYDPATRTIFWYYRSIVSLAAGFCDNCLAYCIATDRWTSISLPYYVGAACNSAIVRGTYGQEVIVQTFLLGAPPPIMAGATYSGTYTLTGPALAAIVGTNEGQFSPGGARSFLRGIRPLADGGAPTITCYARNNLMDAPVASAPSAVDASGMAPFRLEARFFQATIDMPAGATWTHIEGADLDAVPGGLR